MRKELFTDLLQADNKIEALKLMPSKIEDGVVYDFHNNAMFNVSNKDTNIMDEGVIKSRYTDALEKRYLLCLRGIDFDIVGGAVVDTDTKELSLEDELLELVAAGDKKAVRAICKDLKEKWFALDDVEDAIDDIKDCVADKNVAEVKNILAKLFGDDNNVEVETETKQEDTPVEVETETKQEDTPVEVDEIVAEIIEDIKTAIKEDDTTDLKELLAELAEEVGEDSDTYKEYLAKAIPVETDNEGSELADILEDLEASIKENDTDDVKKYLAELADEVGEDSDTYKEWLAKATPEKKSRRTRRGK